MLENAETEIMTSVRKARFRCCMTQPMTVDWSRTYDRKTDRKEDTNENWSINWSCMNWTCMFVYVSVFFFSR
jgi:hypothetical protein